MKLYINKGQYGFYTTCKDREKVNKYYLNIGFKQDNEPTTDQIEINNAFFSCYMSKEGIKPKLVVMEFEDIGKEFEEREEEQVETKKDDTDLFEDFGKENVEDKDLNLPF